MSFSGCITKYPDWVGKITELYSLTLLEARCSKSRCPQGHTPLRALGEGLPLLSPASSVTSILGAPQRMHTSLQSLPPAALCPYMCPLLIRTPVNGFKVHPNPVGPALIYTLITSANSISR